MLMAEELDSHACKSVLDYRIEGDLLYVSDGELWYPLKLHAPTKKQQPKRTPDEGNTTRLLVVLHVGLFKKVLQSG
jgi:hypothetical protein